MPKCQIWSTFRYKPVILNIKWSFSQAIPKFKQNRALWIWNYFACCLNTDLRKTIRAIFSFQNKNMPCLKNIRSSTRTQISATWTESGFFFLLDLCICLGVLLRQIDSWWLVRSWSFLDRFQKWLTIAFFLELRRYDSSKVTWLALCQR